MNRFLELALKLRRIYWWVRRPQTLGARAILLNDQGYLLLVKHTYGKGWYLPGGMVNRNEPVEDGLGRELREELGVTSIIIDRALGTYTNLQEYKKDTITVYILKKYSPIGKSDAEIMSAGFFASNNLPEDTSPGTRRRIQEYFGERPIATTW